LHRLIAPALPGAFLHSISSVTTAPTTAIFLHAFDLVELHGDDLRRDPLEVRKATLTSIVAKAGPA